jgi:molybdenum cofactor cytidylyltransferase
MNDRTLPTLAIAVLAAGYSTRLGRPKALAAVRGVTLLRRTLAVLRPHAAAKILVVTPRRAGRYGMGSEARHATFVANPRRAEGLSSSVRCALEHAQGSAALLLLPVDLARLQSRDIARLISAWRGRRRFVVARSRDGNPATPLILPRRFFGAARGLSGDLGLREWVRQVPRGQMTLVSMPSAEADVDTREDLAAARRRPGARIQTRGACTSR